MRLRKKKFIFLHLFCFKRENEATAKNLPAAVTGSEHHPEYQHPHTVFELLTSPTPAKSSQFPMFHDTMIFTLKK